MPDDICRAAEKQKADYSAFGYKHGSPPGFLWRLGLVSKAVVVRGLSQSS
jgi:hypothetical protein